MVTAAKLGLRLGHWGTSPANRAGLVVAAEDVGFDIVFRAEGWDWMPSGRRRGGDIVSDPRSAWHVYRSAL